MFHVQKELSKQTDSQDAYELAFNHFQMQLMRPSMLKQSLTLPARENASSREFIYLRRMR